MEIHHKICELIKQHKIGAVIQVLQAQGSTPLKAGAKAVVEQNGRIWGTIGGGAVEAQAQQRAVEACQSGQAVIFDFQMQGTHTGDNEPVCGGAMRILVNPSIAANEPAYTQAALAIKARRGGVLVTRISTSSPREVTINWISSEVLGDQAGLPEAKTLRGCLNKEMPELFTDQATGAEVFVEPILPRPHLVIAGGGHVGQALTQQAVLVGFDVTVLDDRPEFTQPDLYPPGVTTQCMDMARAIAELALTQDTFIVIVTRGHQCDAEVLAACINRHTGYIGMIGSRRKIAVIRGHMIESGITTEAQFDRIYAPIGLDIGSVTAPEIATSIVAQLIAIRRKGDLTC